MNTEDTIIVFTARDPDRILREGGSQSWVLDARRARQCTYVICAQNQHNPDHQFATATEPHGEGFLIGKISKITPSREEGDEARWHIGISEYARISVPDLWQGWRNPVRYASLEELKIDPTKLSWKNIPDQAGATKRTGQLTIAEAKEALAATFGVRPDDIQITIRA